jgi:hypothetical protein
LLAAAILAGGCAPLDGQLSGGEFHRLCQALAQEHGGRISKQDFLAAAKDKEQAEKIFNTCDTKHRGYLTEADLSEPQKQRMIQEVIRLTEPSR